MAFTRKIKNLIRDLEQNVYCRIKPSKISGVGVFAIKNIPKGAEIFKTARKANFIPVEPNLIFDNSNINDELKMLVKDLCVIERGKLYLPEFSLNEVDISFFLNHSNKPNTIDKNGERFFAKRNIKRGEEITVNYERYCDEY